MALRLVVDDFTGSGWVWRLFDESDVLLAHHEVKLVEGDELAEGFEDLYDWVRFRADHADWLASEQKWVDRVGVWVGEKVLGRVGTELVKWAPVTVRVIVPVGAEALLYRPFELGMVDGRRMVDHEVGFVYEPVGEEPYPNSSASTSGLSPSISQTYSPHGFKE